MKAQRGLWMFAILAAVSAGIGCKDEHGPRAQLKPIETQPAVTAVPAPVAVAPPAVVPSPGTAPSAVTPPAVAVAPAAVAGTGTEAGSAASSKPAPSTQVSNAATTAAPESAPKVDPSKSPQTARLNGWYQWRGPEQNGVSREKGLPEKWDPDTGENVLWTADVGGMSSPVIWNGKLYTWTRVGEVAFGEGDFKTLAPGPKTQEALVCVDINTGKVLWTHTNNMTQTEVPFHRLGWSSPCVDPSTGRVYALGSQCWLLCLEGDSGKVVWQRQMTEEFGMISTFGGRTQSPAVDEDQLFITGVSFGFGDNARGQHRIYSFNKSTGELNWTNATGGTPVDAPQNTPVTAVIKGQRIVIFAAGDGGVHAFQSRTGKKVWTFKASKRGLNTSVVLDGERLYCTHGLDNFDTGALGRVFCIDIGNLENGSPKEIWAKTGIEAGFPTPVVTEKKVFVVDDRAKLVVFDKMTGKQETKKYNLGHVGKSSPVYGDGKLYVADGDGKFWIYSVGEKDLKTLSKVDLNEKLGREYVIYGSPALADGRLYVQAATKLYCIGSKDKKPEYGEIPPISEEKAAEEKVASIQLVPADAALSAGQSVKFRVRTFDANGRFLKEVPGDQAKWEIAQLTIPAPPPRPAMPKPEDAPATPAPADPSKPGAVEPEKPAANAADPSKPVAVPVPDETTEVRPGEVGTTKEGLEAIARLSKAEPTVVKPGEGSLATKEGLEAIARLAKGGADAGYGQPATAPSTAPAGPTKAGNLQGEIAGDGTFKSKPGPHQAGAIQATIDGVTGEARVRVFPPLPWKFDFEQNPVGKPPLTWLGAGGKYAVVQDPDDANNKVLQKLYDIDLYYRARTNFGMENMSNYTVQADAKVYEKMAAGRRYVPTAAVLNSRYVLALEGMGQKLQIHIWPSALPDERNPSGSQHKDIDFPFDAKKWYRLKLQVTQGGDKAVARGKAWPVDGQEPKDWMLTLEDPIPNRNGNPGLFSVSLVGQFKSEVFYDNILVTSNTPPQASAEKKDGK